MAPLVEVSWLAVGEVAVLAAGAWALFAELCTAREGSLLGFATGERGRRIARLLFALSLPAFGLSHFIYIRETTAMVPSWLPFRSGWAYLTGAGHTAAGVGLLLSISPRRAAAMEAAMLTIFTGLVWVPAVSSVKASQNDWSELVLSWAIARRRGW